jgi:tRNA A37 methylthiotransferase MiaB
MPGRVAPRVAAQRASELATLSDTLLAEFTARFAGSTAEVLWEGGGTPPANCATRKSGSGYLMSGFTENYIKVTAPRDAARINTIERVTL